MTTETNMGVMDLIKLALLFTIVTLGVLVASDIIDMIIP